MKPDKTDPALVDLIAGFGGRLRAAREALGLTAAELSRRLGVDPTRYSHWENGQHPPGPYHLAKLQADHGVASDWILRGDYRSVTPEVWARMARPTIIDRLRWVREAHEPDTASWAKILGVPTEIWRAYETGREIPPDRVIAETAARTGVPAPFILAGELSGLPDEFRLFLLEAHPEAWPDKEADRPKRRGRPQGSGNNGRSNGRASG